MLNVVHMWIRVVNVNNDIYQSFKGSVKKKIGYKTAFEQIFLEACFEI